MTHGGWVELVKGSNQRGVTISTAESCTGGYISHIITDVPDASKCFVGGVVAYSDDLKINTLWVEEKTIVQHGTVSKETTQEMSRGIRSRTGSDIGLAVTGIAGPSGGTVEKPVGTVFISVDMKDGNTITEGFLLEGLSRNAFKKEVSERALGMLLGCQFFL
jgi:nicotinamide-nucleotide amidase